MEAEKRAARRCNDQAGIENDHLARLYEARGRFGDAQFLLAVQPLLLVQRRVAQRCIVNRERASVSALQASLFVQMFQVFADGNKGSGKAAGQVGDHHAAVALD